MVSACVVGQSTIPAVKIAPDTWKMPEIGFIHLPGMNLSIVSNISEETTQICNYMVLYFPYL